MMHVLDCQRFVRQYQGVAGPRLVVVPLQPQAGQPAACTPTLCLTGVCWG